MPPSSIIKDCSQFLRQAKGSPLYINLPRSGDGFRKVKIRKKSKHKLPYEQYFDMAFMDQYKDLRLRSMIAHTTETKPTDASSETFYAFPVDGFQILYNQNIQNYAQYISRLREVITNTSTSEAETIVKNIFEYTYTRSSIEEAIASGGDILIYGIPYYYAIRKSLISDYKSFITY